MTSSRPRKAPPPTHCSQCGKPLPEQVGPGRPRGKCLRCAPRPAKTTHDGRARQPVTVLVEPAPAADDGRFGVRGQELWDEWADQMPNPGAVAVLREACRLADRAERMHRILMHDRQAWAALKLDELLEDMLEDARSSDVLEVNVILNVTSVVLEARNTATALNTLINGLRSAVRQAGADKTGEDDEDAIAAIARQMADRAPSSGNVVQMRQR